MKIRNHRKREWWFSPPKGSPICKSRWYRFKYKSDLMRFLNHNLVNAVNGEVRLEECSFWGSYCLKSWIVWHKDGIADLRLIHKMKTPKVSKTSKQYFAFSDKIINIMTRIDGDPSPEVAKSLVKLFQKRGFKDFEPTEDDWQYINGHIKQGIDFYHWSDRCNWLRTKTIIEYFKQKNLI